MNKAQISKVKSKNIKYKLNHGFTLVELLVAAGIIAIISVFSVQILFDTITSRSKQNSISDTDDNFRVVMNDITAAVIASEDVEIPDEHTIYIQGLPCKTVRFNSSIPVPAIEVATDNTEGCIPPTSGFSAVTNENFQFDSVSFTPVDASPEQVSFYVAGIYKDSLGEHPFTYQTTVVPRLKL